MRKMIRSLIFFTLLSSCISGKIKNTELDLQTRLANSSELQHYRKLEAETLSLNEKEEYFFKRLNDKFIYPEPKLVARERVNQEYGSFYLDENILLLFYLSIKYQESGSELYQIQAQKIIEAIYYFDELNGFDGFMPRYLVLKDDKLTIASEHIKTNSYALLALSYYAAYQAFPSQKIKTLITKHTEIIAKYFLDNQLNLVTPNEQNIKYAALDHKFVVSRQLDGLSFFEAALAIVKEDDLKSEISLLLAEHYRPKYKKKFKPLYGELFGFWQLASPSSNWLNLLKMYNLVKITDDEIYKFMFARLYQKLADEQNIFYDLLYLDIFPDKAVSKLTLIAGYLQSFPLDLSAAEIINSHRDDIKLQKFPKITKNKRWLSAKTALPIYARPLMYHEWKRNQLRLNGNQGNYLNHVTFNGLDFLLANALYQKALRATLQ